MASNKGEPCVSRSQCSTGTCHDNVCVVPSHAFEFCDSKYGCEGGLECDGRSLVCLKPGFKKNDRGVCDTAADCPQHQYCDKNDEHGGFCVDRRRAGEECNEKRSIELGGNECAGDPCVEGKCRTLCLLSNKHSCKEGETCRKVTETHGFCIEETAKAEPVAAPVEPIATPAEPITTPAEPGAKGTTESSWLAKLGLEGTSKTMLGLYGVGAGLVLLLIVLLLVYVIRRCCCRGRRDSYREANVVSPRVTQQSPARKYPQNF